MNSISMCMMALLLLIHVLDCPSGDRSGYGLHIGRRGTSRVINSTVCMHVCIYVCGMILVVLH